eukprot:CAMPEP_0185846334 /NCGR_PEP_ID=MMETSP1354-20130828/2012_1 /TAXON_ID=708628 /ORGANISM="Erythrolobus madagascarensis, Strain CCMP3276" /LENGTH=251 /DNA_ID=CAMNT_0028546455 /DNA_START=33 /DNA_END=788 /DNA_ORIENTATION=+
MKRTKEEYKLTRTEYSDAMIDLEMEISASAEPRARTQQRVEEKRVQYEEYSEKFAHDALQFETLYRDELTQRIAAHQTAQLHMLRGASAAFKKFYKYSKALTLDLAALEAQVATADREMDDVDCDEDDAAAAAATLPRPVSSKSVDDSGKGKKSQKKSKKHKSKQSNDSAGDDDPGEMGGAYNRSSTAYDGENGGGTRSNPFDSGGDGGGSPAASNPFADDPFGAPAEPLAKSSQEKADAQVTDLLGELKF